VEVVEVAAAEVAAVEVGGTEAVAEEAVEAMTVEAEPVAGFAVTEGAAEAVSTERRSPPFAPRNSSRRCALGSDRLLA
jgi:hypothetical protein